MECHHDLPKGVRCKECFPVEVDDPVVMHPLPQEAIDKFDEYEAALVARDEVLKGRFKWQYKKAVYFGKIAAQSRREFWAMVEKTYPEIGNWLTYHANKGTVSTRK